MSAELNSKIGAHLDSMGADTRGSEPMAGDESEAPMAQALLEAGSIFLSSAVESTTSVAGSSLPSSHGAMDLGPGQLQALSPKHGPDDRFKSCSS